MPFTSCPACRGTGWGAATPPALCEECDGHGLVRRLLDTRIRFPRFGATKVRRWRRGEPSDNGGYEWIVVRDYGDGTVAYRAERHTTLPGFVVELAAYSPDPGSDLISDDDRRGSYYDDDRFLRTACGELALFREEGVIDYHLSFGHARERYVVYVESQSWDGAPVIDLETWDVCFLNDSFPEACD